MSKKRNYLRCKYWVLSVGLSFFLINPLNAQGLRLQLENNLLDTPITNERVSDDSSKEFDFLKLKKELQLKNKLLSSSLPTMSSWVDEKYVDETTFNRWFEAALSCLINSEDNYASHEVTFKNYFIQTMCHHPQVKQLVEEIKKEAYLVQKNKSINYPQLSLNNNFSQSKQMSQSTSKSNQVGINVSYLLYDFGRSNLVLSADEKLFLAFIEKSKGVLGNFALELFLDWQALKSATAKEQRAKAQVKESQKIFEKVLAQKEVGKLTALELNSAKVNLATEKLNLMKVSLEKEKVFEKIKRNMDPRGRVELDKKALNFERWRGLKSLMEKNDISQWQLVLEKRSDLLSLAYQKDGLFDSYKSKEKESLPKVELSGSIKNINQRTDFTQSGSTSNNGNQVNVGVAISIPLFTGFSQTFEQKAKSKEIEAKKYEYQSALLKAKQDLYEQWQTVKILEQNIEVAKASVEASNLALEAADERLSAGLISYIDYLSVYRQWIDGLERKDNAIIEYETKAITFLSSTGSLLDTNGLVSSLKKETGLE